MNRMPLRTTGEDSFLSAESGSCTSHRSASRLTLSRLIVVSWL